MKKTLFIAALVALSGAGGWWWYKSQSVDVAAGEAAVVGAPKVGSVAPLFKTKGALAGKPFDLDLAEQIKKGPVVMYFFPKVFTEGCTLEAREFAERSADFAALGASVVGLSADSLPELTKFSEKECRDKFAVAQATPEIIKAYDVKLPVANMTNRTSFVIGQDGKIKFIHSKLDYKDHVKLTYEAVQKLKAGVVPTT